VDIDDARQINIFSGHVVMTQGTLAVSGDQIIVVQDKAGFKHGTATGKLATFRQKREGYSEYVEGYGERIEYDTGSEIMNIFGQAHVKRGQDEVRGEHITYNTKTEIFQASGAPDKIDSQSQRVHVVIQPKTANASAPAAVPPNEPLTIKPETTITLPGATP
jgi:lipopolysaccharide export system protein LptA